MAAKSPLALLLMSVWSGETEGENDDWWGQGDQVTPTLFDLISGTSLVWLLS